MVVCSVGVTASIGLDEYIDSIFSAQSAVRE